MNELYTVPPGLDSSETRAAISAEFPAVSDHHYVANGCLCHCYTDRATGTRVRVVESPTSGVSAEFIGDSGLWLRIRAVVMQVKARREAASSTRPSGEAAA